MQASNHQLRESQLIAFLHQKGVPERIISYFRELSGSMQRPVRNILDCGGGSGVYLDMLLEQFPNATGTLVDSAQFMLDQNIPHPRKRLVLENLENLFMLGRNGERFDLICFIDVLHHCVTKTYRNTRAMQMTILKNAAQLLSPQGQILISERIMESWVCDGFSSRFIYHLTKNKLMAPLIRRAGANTAGVGVCFMSKRQLADLANDAGLQLISEDVLGQPRNHFNAKALLQRCFVGLQSISNVIFRLAPPKQNPITPEANT